MQLTENRFNPLFRLKELDDKECEETIAYLEQLRDEGISLFTRNNNPKNYVNRNLLLMILYMRISKKKNALQHLLQYEKICQQTGRKLQDYYYDIIKLLKGEPINMDSQHARIAYAFVSHPERALHAITTPDCFDCEHCELKEGCRYPLLSQLEDVIQKAMAEKIIDQNTLKEIF